MFATLALRIRKTECISAMKASASANAVAGATFGAPVGTTIGAVVGSPVGTEVVGCKQQCAAVQPPAAQSRPGGCKRRINGAEQVKLAHAPGVVDATVGCTIGKPNGGATVGTDVDAAVGVFPRTVTKTADRTTEARDMRDKLSMAWQLLLYAPTRGVPF